MAMPTMHPIINANITNEQAIQKDEEATQPLPIFYGSVLPCSSFPFMHCIDFGAIGCDIGDATHK